MEKSEILIRLSQSFDRLKRDYNVAELHLFGSFARNEASDESDIDLLVKFSAPISLFTFVRLQRDLEDLLGRHVDLATRGSIRPALWNEISKDLERAA